MIDLSGTHWVAARPSCSSWGGKRPGTRWSLPAGGSTGTRTLGPRCKQHEGIVTSQQVSKRLSFCVYVFMNRCTWTPGSQGPLRHKPWGVLSSLALMVRLCFH